jgi:hypothetical protein
MNFLGAAEVLATLPSSLMQLILDDCCSSTDSIKLVTALAELTMKNPNLKMLSIVGGEVSFFLNDFLLLLSVIICKQ